MGITQSFRCFIIFLECCTVLVIVQFFSLSQCAEQTSDLVRHHNTGSVERMSASSMVIQDFQTCTVSEYSSSLCSLRLRVIVPTTVTLKICYQHEATCYGMKMERIASTTGVYYSPTAISSDAHFLSTAVKVCVDWLCAATAETTTGTTTSYASTCLHSIYTPQNPSWVPRVPTWSLSHQAPHSHPLYSFSPCLCRYQIFSTVKTNHRHFWYHFSVIFLFCISG